MLRISPVYFRRTDIGFSLLEFSLIVPLLVMLTGFGVYLWAELNTQKKLDHLLYAFSSDFNTRGMRVKANDYRWRVFMNNELPSDVNYPDRLQEELEVMTDSLRDSLFGLNICPTNPCAENDYRIEVYHGGVRVKADNGNTLGQFLQAFRGPSGYEPFSHGNLQSEQRSGFMVGLIQDQIENFRSGTAFPLAIPSGLFDTTTNQYYGNITPDWRERFNPNAVDPNIKRNHLGLVPLIAASIEVRKKDSALLNLLNFFAPQQNENQAKTHFKYVVFSPRNLL